MFAISFDLQEAAEIVEQRRDDLLDAEELYDMLSWLPGFSSPETRPAFVPRAMFDDLALALRPSLIMEQLGGAG